MGMKTTRRRRKEKIRSGTGRRGKREEEQENQEDGKERKKEKKREQKLKLKHFRHHSLVLKTDPALSSSQKSVQK